MVDIDWQTPCLQLLAGTRYGKKIQRAADFLGDALLHAQPVEVYAKTTFEGFWYKVYFFTPHGVFSSTTTSECVGTKQWTLALIRYTQRLTWPLALTSLEGVMQNWQQYGVWQDRRPIGAALLRIWAHAHGVDAHLIHHDQK